MAQFIRRAVSRAMKWRRLFPRSFVYPVDSTCLSTYSERGIVRTENAGVLDVWQTGDARRLQQTIHSHSVPEQRDRKGDQDSRGVFGLDAKDGHG